MGNLNIESFEAAVKSLEEVVLAQEKVPEDTFIRDACIQRFEYTYELAHKMLRRFLEITSANPDEFATMSFQDIVRNGSERGLLRSDLPAWLAYRKARATTSHTYDEKKAKKVLASVPGFLADAQFLRDRLRENAG